MARSAQPKLTKRKAVKAKRLPGAKTQPKLGRSGGRRGSSQPKLRRR